MTASGLDRLKILSGMAKAFQAASSDLLLASDIQNAGPRNPDESNAKVAKLTALVREKHDHLQKAFNDWDEPEGIFGR
jgi:hypothetical protein